LVFLSKVARQLVASDSATRAHPRTGQAIRRAVAALKRLPEPSRGIDVLIEVSHRMGSEEFSEHYRYTIALEQERIAIHLEREPARSQDRYEFVRPGVVRMAG